MNWREEAIDKLRIYDQKKQASENIPIELERLEAEAASLRGVSADKVSVKGGGGGRENALINNLVLRTELERNLEDVNAWLKTVDNSLAALNPDERLILYRLYMYPPYHKKNVLNQLCEELNVESSTIYRRREKALEKFTMAMYGRKES